MVMHRHKWFWPKVSMKKNIHGWMFIKIKDSGQGSAMIKYDTKHTEGPDLVRNPVIWLITIIREANLHIMVEYIVNFILENQNVLHWSWRLVVSVANHVPKGCSDVLITLSCAKVSWQIPTIHKLMLNKLWFQIVYLISLHYVWLRKLVLTQNRPVFFCARKPTILSVIGKCSFWSLIAFDKLSFKIQSSAIIIQSNIVPYYMNDYRNRGKISIRCWIHKLWGVFCE